MAKTSNSFNHITTIIFDMDGTLIEHTWQLSRVCDVLFTHFADDLKPVTQDEFFNSFWSKSEDMWHMMVDGVLNGDTAARYAYINTLRSLGCNVDLAQPMLNYWMEIVLTEAIPFEDTFEVLEAIRRNYTTGILTNGFINLQRQKIERYKLADFVDFTLVSEEAGYHKPDKRAFFEALKLAGNPSPEETLYIGDNLIADIKGAIDAGLTPLFIDVKDRTEPPEGVIKIQRLAELLRLLPS